MNKPYGEIRFDVILEHLNKYRSLTEKEEKEIHDGIKEIMDTYKYHIGKTQDLINEYFSDRLWADESPSGAMRRNQIRKELLEFASKKV